MLDSYLAFFLPFNKHLLNTCTVLAAGEKIWSLPSWSLISSGRQRYSSSTHSDKCKTAPGVSAVTQRHVVLWPDQKDWAKAEWADIWGREEWIREREQRVHRPAMARGRLSPRHCYNRRPSGWNAESEGSGVRKPAGRGLLYLGLPHTNYSKHPNSLLALPSEPNCWLRE